MAAFLASSKVYNWNFSLQAVTLNFKETFNWFLKPRLKLYNPSKQTKLLLLDILVVPRDSCYFILRVPNMRLGVLDQLGVRETPSLRFPPISTSISNCKKKVQIGNDQEKAQSERNSHSKNRGGKNFIDNEVLILRKHIVSQVSSYSQTHAYQTFRCSTVG